MATASFIMPQHQYDSVSVETYGDDGSVSGRNGDSTDSDDTLKIEEPPPVSNKSKKLAVAAGHGSSHRSSDQPAPRTSTSIGDTSHFKGVRWSKKSSKWQARIRIDGTPNHLGFFND